MRSVRKWFKRYFDLMWEDRPWWFNWFVAGPLAILIILFLPIGYFLVPPFRRFVNGVSSAIDDDYVKVTETYRPEPQ